MKNQRWFIVSSTENIKYFFYVNLIVDAQGFPKDSFYKDMQTAAPAGYILCCTQEKLSAAIQLAQTEDKNLKMCILELNFKYINFQHFFYRDSHDNIYFATASGNGELLLPAPLPLQVIKTIFTQDENASLALQNEFANDIGVIDEIEFKPNSKLFAVKEFFDPNITPWPTSQVSVGKADKTCQEIQIQPRNLNYTKAFAYSGALALSFYQSKNGSDSEDMFTALKENKFDKKWPDLQNLFSWCMDNIDPHDQQGEAQLYRLILDEISQEPDHGTIKFHIMNLIKAKNKLPEQLQYVHQFADRLEKINDHTTDKSADQIFSDIQEAAYTYPKWSKKIFLLLCMVFERDHTATMLKFYHQKFSQQDYMLLAIFYGFMFGIVKVPNEIKNIKNLRNWLSAKAAIFMHDRSQSKYSCEKLPAEPPLLRSKYIHDGTSNKLQENFTKLCKHLNFTETEFSSWELKTHTEYKVNGNTMTFSKRPIIKLIIDNAKLDSSIHELIGNDELFDFNALYKLFEK